MAREEIWARLKSKFGENYVKNGRGIMCSESVAKFYPWKVQDANEQTWALSTNVNSDTFACNSASLSILTNLEKIKILTMILY